MFENFIKFKKNIKTRYLLELRNYYKENNFITLNTDKNFLYKSFYQYKNISYPSLWYLIRKIVSDFINHKEIVFIGADGAGKSTITSIINTNISFYVSSQKKYFSGFFYPSGRTNLFFIKTSKIFLFIKLIKDFIYKNLQNIVSYKSKSSSLVEKNKLKKLRNTNNLRLFHFQFILVILSSIFIFDSWLHKIINRFSFYRLVICDRYYDDILINYTNPYVRKLIKYLIPKSKNKFYLYATPEEHFNRKKNEDIEMIRHMQQCYTENQKYVIKIPTNVNQTLITKKILKIVITSI